MRSAMRTNDPCRVHAPVLAALEEYEERGLDAAAVDAARAHLATCPRCQARRRTFARLDDALRATVLAGPAPAYTTADLLAAIGADHEPRERRTPMLSVVTMRDEDDMDDENQTPATDGGEDPPSATPGAPTFAPLPTLRPAPQSTRRRALTGLVAAAAVVALVAGIAGAMNLSGRLHGRQGSRPAATATTQANQPGGPFYQFTALSMDSPTDGWAAVVNAWQMNSTIMLHITNGVAVKQATLPGAAFGPTILRAFSPTDVWLMRAQGQQNFYHYDGKAWGQIDLPAPTNAQGNSVSVQSFQMLSPTEGWAIASYSPPPTPTNGTPVSLFVFYRFDGASWHIEPADKAATVGSLADQGQNSATDYQITSMAATANGDVWATGYIQTTDSNGNITFTQSVIFHRVGGVWRLAKTAKDYEYTGIAMASPTRGWIIGQHFTVTKINTTIAPYSVTAQDPIALAWDGTRWSPAAVPALSQSQQGLQFTQVTASSPTSAWILGQPNNSSFTANNQYASDNTYLAHYDGARWAPVALPQIAAIKPSNDVAAVNQVSFYDAATTPAGDLWLAGALTDGMDQGAAQALLLYHYANGQWTSVPLPRLA